jgi:hypothetical protein
MSADLKIITRESLREKAIARRIAMVQESKHPLKAQFLEQLQEGVIPNAVFPEGYNLKNVTKLHKDGDRTVAEFIGAGSISQDFFNRQKYEVDAGRDQEPLLFTGLYNITRDSSLPESFDVNTLGPGGVVFERVEEGGEVKFASLKESEHSVHLYQYAAGIEYSERIFRFNQLFRLPFIERQFGVASNAVQNYIHFNPILTAAYVAANQTAASAVGSTLEEKYHNTFDAAITHSRADTTYPRRGPYTLLCSTTNLSMARKAVTRVPQQGFEKQSPEVFDSITGLIAYDGWTGVRGKKATTYSGVTANKAYLISTGYRELDLQSFYQQDLRQQRGDGDLSRFIVEQVIWDLWLGVYANPRASVEEVTLPTS